MSYFFISMSLKMLGLMILNTPLTISVSLKFSEASVHLSAYNIIRDVRRVVTNLASVYLELTWLDTWESPQGESKVMSYMSGLFSLVLMLCGSTLLYCRLGKVSVLCGCCHILVYFPAKCFSILLISVLVLGSAPLTPLKICCSMRWCQVSGISSQCLFTSGE